MNLGNASHSEVWQQIAETLGRKEKAQELVGYLEEKKRNRRVNTPLLDLSDRLRGLGYKTGILSNATTRYADWVRERGVDTHFDVYLPSAEIGFMKPDPQAFHALATALQVDPQELIFIDDAHHSLSTAEKVGYTPIFYEGYEALVSRLQQLSILP